MGIPDANQTALIEEIILNWEQHLTTIPSESKSLTLDEFISSFDNVDDVILAEVRRRASALEFMNLFLAGTPSAEPCQTFWKGRSFAVQKSFLAQHTIGQGGRSAVLCAYDETLERNVAIKTVLHPSRESPNTRKRLIQEAMTIGHLDHPGILPIYDFGETESGIPFYSMPIVDGLEMSKAIADLNCQPLDRSYDRNLKQLLRSFISICQTIGYAHSRNIVHRDIKPENIMLGRFGEAYLVDWGLCKRSDQDDFTVNGEQVPAEPVADMTHTGDSLGTPAYMSPEQTRRIPHHDAKLSDIFNLGATLYTILTGSVPFPGDRIVDILSASANCEYRKPRLINPRIDESLASVCDKAMAADPIDRYQNPLELVDDLESWFGDEPVSCVRETVITHVSRFGRHNSKTISIVALICLLFGIIAGILAASLNSQKLRADKNAKLAWQTVNDTVAEYRQNELLSFSGFRPLRDQLVRLSVEKYESLLTNQNKTGLDPVDLAGAYAATGQLFLDQGELAKAEAMLSDGIRIFEAKSNWQSDHKAALWLASKWIDLFRIATSTNNTKIQVEMRDRFETIQLRFPESPLVQAKCMDFLITLADTQIDSRDNAGADTTLKTVVSRPTSSLVVNKFQEARFQFVRARLSLNQELFQAAQSGFDACQTTLKSVLIENPKDLRAAKLRLAALTELAAICETLSQSEQRITAIQETVAFLEQLIVLFPSVNEFRNQLHSNARLLATEYEKSGQWDLCLSTMETVVRSGSPNAPRGLQTLKARMWIGAGNWHRTNGRNNEALVAFSRARQIAENSGKSMESETLAALGQSLLLIGSNQWMVGNNLESIETFQECEAVFARLAARRHEPRFLELHAVSIMAQALSNALSGNVDQATNQCRTTIEKLQEIVDQNGSSENLELGLESCHFLLATSLEMSGDESFKHVTQAGRNFRPRTTEGILNLARTYALESQLYGRGQRQFRETDRFFVKRYHQKVVALLNAAAEMGFEDFDSLLEDPAYFGVFRDSSFRDLVLKTH